MAKQTTKQTKPAPIAVVDAKKDILNRLKRYAAESYQSRAPYEQRIAKNLRLIRGLFSPETSTASKVRGRSKLFYRKIWSINWRLLAAAYAAFLRDPETFKVMARGPEDVKPRAEILQIMLEYRRDYLMQTRNFFLQQLWAFQDIFETGAAGGKWRWVFHGKQDHPDFVLYPFEQLILDFLAETEDAQRFTGFENYSTREALEREGYSSTLIESLSCSAPSYNQIRAVRFATLNDPLQNPSATEYPPRGQYHEGGTNPDQVGNRYCVTEWFWREQDRMKMAVVCGDKWLKEPIDSPYGDEESPLVYGTCLSVPHQLVGEGFAESLEGPQESINASINARKDNFALQLNRPTIVGRFANIDLQSLINRRAGGIVLADDVNQVRELEMSDATRTAYQDAAADEIMMQDMSGIIPALEGRSQTDKATVAQLNLAQGNAKLELYLAVMEKTFMSNLYGKLARMIQRFETDATIFRVANQQYTQRKQVQLPFPILSIDDFVADVVVEVGIGAISRDQEIQRLVMAMDRGMQSNNAVALMAKAGITPPDGSYDVVNVPKIFQDLLRKFGKRDVEDYILKWQLQQPQQAASPDQSLGPAGQVSAGLLQPQLMQGKDQATTPQQMQQGGLGGF